MVGLTVPILSNPFLPVTATGGAKADILLWSSNTSYLAGEERISPDNKLFTCAISHTSGANFTIDKDAGKWTLIGDGSLTAAQVKTLYESNLDTNAFTNTEKTKLSNQSGTNTGDQDFSTNKTPERTTEAVAEYLFDVKRATLFNRLAITNVAIGNDISPDGLSLVYYDSTTKELVEKILTIPFDTTNITATNILSVSLQVGAGAGRAVKRSKDGTKLYLLCDSPDAVFQYTALTPFRLTGMLYANKSFSITQDTTPRGLTFGDDDKKMYIVGNTTKKMFQFTVVAGEMDAVTYDNISILLSGDSSPLEVRDCEADSVGFKIWYIEQNNVYQIDLLKQWDISSQTKTAPNHVIVFSLSGESGFHNGLSISADGRYLFNDGVTPNQILSFKISRPVSEYEKGRTLAALVTKSAGQEIPNNVTTSKVSWDVEQYDTFKLHDNVTNNSRLIASEDGLYRAEAMLGWDTNSSGKRAFAFQINGSGLHWIVYGPTSGASNPTRISGSKPFSLKKNDYVEVIPFQNSGGVPVSITLTGNDGSFFSLHKIGEL